jgi:hypothetical protein
MILAKIASLFFSVFVIDYQLFSIYLGRRRSALVQWRYHQRIVPELNLDGGFPAIVL